MDTDLFPGLSSPTTARTRTQSGPTGSQNNSWGSVHIKFIPLTFR